MFPTPSHPWEDPFYISQWAAVVFWIIALATVRLQRRVSWLRSAALGVAILTELVLPITLNAIDPIAGGFDWVRGLVASVGASGEAALSCVWAAVSSADMVGPRLLASASARNDDMRARPSTRPFVIVGVLGMAYWVLWVFRLFL